MLTMSNNKIRGYVRNSSILVCCLIFAIHEASCLPAAQMTSDPSGPWNSNGSGDLNASCIPLAEPIIEGFLNGSVTLDSINAYRALLAAITGIGNPYGELETPQAIRIGVWIHTALWDAAAVYDDTASQIVDSTVERRPEKERTLRNQNIAMVYAALRVAEAMLPKAVNGILLVMQTSGLDPEDRSMDPSTPAGVGNLVGKAVIEEQAKDGYNSDGMMGNTYNQRNFSDYTNFIPLNTAYELTNITKWQPLLETNGKGYFTIQTHVTPPAKYAAFKLGASVLNSTDGKGILEEPYSDPVDLNQYQQQTDYVLAVSANLTDKQKMLSEYFDSKFTSFGVLEWYLAPESDDLLDNIGASLNIVCIGNAINFAWQQKLIYNSVRPVSAVRHLYGGKNVTAWAGQFKGTQEIDGNDWLPYMRTMPHADYPSGTACVCSAFAEYLRHLHDDPNEFPDIPPIVFRKGCSRREPNFTPAKNVSVTWESWDDFVEECGRTRLWAGVHFTPAIDTAIEMCKPLGEQCYLDYQKLRNGTA